MIRTIKIKGTDHRDWLTHPQGKKSWEKAEKEMISRLAILVSACQDSIDPAVLKALNKYEQIASLVDFLTPSQAKDDE